jgi:hypothetical protein
MLNEIFQILKQAVMITSFVFLMMMLIEYINVQTNGVWQKVILSNKWKQYLVSALLGAIPGCLGAFTAVTLFSHRLISFGAIVAAMIATSGDEAFVMFAMFPDTALLLTVLIFIIALIAGYITDKLYTPKRLIEKIENKSFPLHPEEQCHCFKKENLIPQVTHPSFYRIVLTVILLLILLALITGSIAGGSKTWIKITLIITLSFSLFVVISVPEHFLKEHLWKHIVKKHIIRVFLWTFGTLLLTNLIMEYININEVISNNMLIVICIAVLVGLIPESGPHLVFVTLFAQGTIPFSVLLASSIAQDGHGMLPMLAESKRCFVAVKLVNVFFGLIIGITTYLIGF